VRSRVTCRTGPAVSLSFAGTTGESDEGPMAVEMVLEAGALVTRGGEGSGFKD